MSAIREDQIPDLIREGKDKEVMPLLYKKVLPMVRKYVLGNSGNVDDAYDVFHDALMLFYEQLLKGEYQEKYKVFGYLYRISVFRWINKAKKDKNVQLSNELPDVAFDPKFYEEPVFIDKGESNLIEELFSNIGSKCVELLTYSIYTTMLMEDIMVRMGLSSVDATRMQQMRCRQKLMKEIEKNPRLLEKLKGL
ncbi:MAG TPA: hypothetical protein VL947_09060 [Cytophagales bacterium]|nr:hypothetical protein [Cytophagales bacterium]